MIFKCKICGANLNVNQGEKIIECEYCGVKQSIPTFIEPKSEEEIAATDNHERAADLHLSPMRKNLQELIHCKRRQQQEQTRKAVWTQIGT